MYLSIDEIEIIKTILDIDAGENIRITKISNGFNIRIIKSMQIKVKKKEVSFREICINFGMDSNYCKRCGKKTYCNPHHIISKSAGGLDIANNGVFLCFDCHVGDNGIHNGKWKIEELFSELFLEDLKKLMKEGKKIDKR